MPVSSRRRPDCTLQTQVLPAGLPMGPMFDQNTTAPTVPNDDNPDNVPSFFTYFGQFLDHDMTLDTLPLPTQFVDPSTIPNLRDPRLNLDSVYGGGPEANPELYATDKRHLLVNGRDLQRRPDGSAILFEGRNDENQIIAQIHVAFVRAHNRLIDQGYNLEHARELMRWRHQWIVVHELLPDVLDPAVYADVFRAGWEHPDPLLRPPAGGQGHHAGGVLRRGLSFWTFPGAQGLYPPTVHTAGGSHQNPGVQWYQRGSPWRPGRSRPTM